MNRYTAAAVLADMRQGRRVLVLSETRALARIAFTEVATDAQEGEPVRRAKGAQEITAGDGQGWVKFCSARPLRGLRGITADVVVFDAHEPSPDALVSVAPNLAASPVGEVTRPQQTGPYCAGRWPCPAPATPQLEAMGGNTSRPGPGPSPTCGA